MEFEIIEKAKELFSLIEGLQAGPKRSESLLNLQRLVAQFDPQQALQLRGRLSSSPAGAASNFSGGIKSEGSPRFNTTPPEPIFVNPKKATNTNADGAVLVATDKAPEQVENAAEAQIQAAVVESQVETIYRKIAKMTAPQVVTTYGESAIEGMLEKLGKRSQPGKNPKQKATFLLNVIRAELGNSEPVADEVA